MNTLEKIVDGSAVVGVIGLGYVGLPLARRATACGFRTVGLDVDEAKVRSLSEGRSYIRHIPPGDVAGMLATGFRPTADFAADLPECDAVLICVPTPLDRMREPDLSCIVDTARKVARSLRRGQLVVLESTTYPGTTREVVLPILEGAVVESDRGPTPPRRLRAEEDFLLAFSPEREDPGNPKWSIHNIPKVVGGIGPRSLEAATALYDRLTDGRAVPVSSCEVAEASKIVENIYRCVNIALVNELKAVFEAMGINVHEVLDAAATKPFGFQRFSPGPGLGGHCIPIDPFYLSWKARQYGVPTRFIELAGETNAAMPERVVNRAMLALNDRGRAVRGSRALVLGLAYKPDVDDVRESPSLELIERLSALGAEVDYHDPHCPRTHRMRGHDLGMVSLPGDGLYGRGDEAGRSPAAWRRCIGAYDLVLIATDHSWYDWAKVHDSVQHGKAQGVIVDTRNAMRGVPDPTGVVVRA
jgi:UDP-N-acetyl-D-glucosamine dehydrogenase